MIVPISYFSIPVKLIHPDAKLPTRAKPGDAGADLYACLDGPRVVDLFPGDRLVVPTGISLAVPRGYYARIAPRSGLAAKHGIAVLNSPGTIDADYRGESLVILFNASRVPFTGEVGDRIAQLVICPVEQAIIEVVVELSDTNRGAGGFGSTGSKS